MERKDIPKLILFIIIIVAFIVMAKRARTGLNEKGKYTKGVITGFSDGARGARYVHYGFYIDNAYYSSFESYNFCSDCKSPCCNIGDSVIVHFQKGKPVNCELVHELPE